MLQQSEHLSSHKFSFILIHSQDSSEYIYNILLCINLLLFLLLYYY